MEQNKFTDEQLEILRKGPQKRDFTQTVPLSPAYEDMTPEQAKAFEFFKNLTMGYMHSNLPPFNIKRPTENFTQNHPVNLLMNANASYISNEAMKIAFRMCLDGMGNEIIARILQEEKVLNPTAYWQSQGINRSGKKT